MWLFAPTTSTDAAEMTGTYGLNLGPPPLSEMHLMAVSLSRALGSFCKYEHAWACRLAAGPLQLERETCPSSFRRAAHASFLMQTTHPQTGFLTPSTLFWLLGRRPVSLHWLGSSVPHNRRVLFVADDGSRICGPWWGYPNPSGSPFG